MGAVDRRALTIAAVMDEKEKCGDAINEAIEEFERVTGCIISDFVVVRSPQNGVRVGLRVEVF